MNPISKAIHSIQPLYPSKLWYIYRSRLRSTTDLDPYPHVIDSSPQRCKCIVFLINFFLA